MFLVLLYNLLCKTFKDHSSAFAASSLSERNSLLQERCFPIASAKVEHFCIPCKRSPKKNCEKKSFAPILLLHNIAKSALKPIFSPLPHPTFFAPKSPFFLLFPVLNPISGVFSREHARFLPCEVLFFLFFPVSNPISGVFSMARYSFQPRNSLLPCFSLYFPRLRALLREISPIIFSALPFLHSVNAFPIRFFPFFIICPTFIFPFISFPLLIPLPLRPLPHFLSHSSPLFQLSPQLTHDRAHSRVTRAYTYKRTHPPVRRFSFIAFTASPTSRNTLCTNMLGVKENEKKPSQNTQPTHYQQIKNKTPISSAVNPIYRRGELKKLKPSHLTHCATTTCGIRVKE